MNKYITAILLFLFASYAHSQGTIVDAYYPTGADAQAACNNTHGVTCGGGSTGYTFNDGYSSGGTWYNYYFSNDGTCPVGTTPNPDNYNKCEEETACDYSAAQYSDTDGLELDTYGVITDSSPTNFNAYTVTTSYSCVHGCQVQTVARDEYFAMPDGTVGYAFYTEVTASNTTCENLPPDSVVSGDLLAENPNTTGNQPDDDTNNDGQSDVPDTDSDGTPDYQDDDIDGDGTPNSTDTDVDGDGIPNDDDPQPWGNWESQQEETTGFGQATDCTRPPTSEGDPQLAGIHQQLWINACSEDEQSEVTAAGDCSAPPDCNGDPLTCEIIRQEWAQYCAGKESIDNLSTELEDELTAQGYSDLDSYAEGGLLAEFAGDDIDLQAEFGNFLTITHTDADCPLPVEFDLGGFGTHQFDYGPFCDFAITVRPFIELLFTILSAFIVFRGVTQ